MARKKSKNLKCAQRLRKTERKRMRQWKLFLKREVKKDKVGVIFCIVFYSIIFIAFVISIIYLVSTLI